MTDPSYKYWLALANAPGIGPARFKILLDHLKTPQSVWDLNPEEVIKILGEKLGNLFLEYKKNIDPSVLIKDIINKNIRLLKWDDSEYPELLKEISDPPPVLYYRGEILKRDKLAVAVVGSRKMTSYGREVTNTITTDLVNSGLTIVSGLAVGVDAAAHQASIQAHGRTIAVLGGGLDKIYPSYHQKLAEEIWSGNGAVVSEFPPDYPPSPGNFPARNRIISGLSLGVLVTEAAKGSGSLITAGCALEQGRDVFAVPGPIYSRTSEGTAELIKQGAKLVSSSQDILDELNLTSVFSNKNTVDESSLTKEEKQIVSILKDGAKMADEIVRLTDLTTSQVNSLLSLLELKGVIKNLGGNQYIIV